MKVRLQGSQRSDEHDKQPLRASAVHRDDVAAMRRVV
jgi:hypothetical protein